MAKYTFKLRSEEKRRDLPGKIIVGQEQTETTNHVVLKLLAYVLFFRERIQIEPNLDIEYLQFTPDIVQLDYELRPRLWVECGECGVHKLHKLAVKVPEAEIWVVKKSRAEAEHLFAAMAKNELRRDRYGLIGLDSEMFNEMLDLLAQRNELTWFRGAFDPPHLQFDFNGLWFDTTFTLLKF